MTNEKTNGMAEDTNSTLDPRFLKVRHYHIRKSEVMMTLSPLQNFVCRIFKIKPEHTYDYEVEVLIDRTEGVIKNDVVESIDKTKWKVIDIMPNLSSILLVNIYPITHFAMLSGHLIIVSRKFDNPYFITTLKTQK
jgi:hypothetical protein